jgi:hypothetical protein
LKALKIYENIDFQRGKDPKAAMGIGYFKDKNGRIIEKGSAVFADPDPNDAFYEFEGTAESFHDEYVTVRDMDDDYFDIEPYKLEVLDESVSFERGIDPHKALRIGKYSNDIQEIVSADIEVMPEPGNQDSYYDEAIDHYEILDVLNNWEASVRGDNYGFWVIDGDSADPATDDPEYLLWKDLEGSTVSYAGNLYDIPKTKYKVKS